MYPTVWEWQLGQAPSGSAGRLLARRVLGRQRSSYRHRPDPFHTSRLSNAHTKLALVRYALASSSKASTAGFPLCRPRSVRTAETRSSARDEAARRDRRRARVAASAARSTSFA
jgi:hypothetical protein